MAKIRINVSLDETVVNKLKESGNVSGAIENLVNSWWGSIDISPIIDMLVKIDWRLERIEQGNKNPLTGTVETSVSTSTDRESNPMARFQNSDLMNRLKSIARWDKVDIVVTKPHISSKWGSKWKMYSEQEQAGWWETEFWWLDWCELVVKEPYKSIKKDIESGDYLF